MEDRPPISKVNLRTLADRLGLSQTTVSRALNGHPGVNAETRARVAAVAETMGYLPDLTARRLATGRAGSVGLAWVADIGAPSDPVMLELVAGIGEIARRNGVAIQLNPIPRSEERTSYRQLAASRQVDGVILTSPTLADDRVAICRELGLPFVLHGRTEAHGPPFPFLDIDNRGAFFRATRLLLRFGHRRIAFLNGLGSYTFARDRAEGALAAYRDSDADPDGLTLCSGPMDEAFGHGTAHSLFGAVRPTALLCSSVVIARGVERALRELGLTVGEDVSVIAHDDAVPFLKPENFYVPLSCTTSSVRSAGRRVCERLVERLGGGEAGGGEVWPVDLIMRESVGPPPRGERS